jgi:hypothetical protein
MRRSSDPIKATARRAKAQRRNGVDAVCTQCGETGANMLVRNSRPKLCEACYAVKRGEKRTQGHHLAGKANSPIVMEVPIKMHRTFSEAQYEWPPGVLDNPDGSPLIAAAGFLLGAADFIQDCIVNGIRTIAEFLQKLDAWLREHMRPDWWKGSDFDGWQVT